MKKMIWFVLFLNAYLMNSLYSSEINYSLFESINEVIEYESLQISSICQENIQALSNAYIDRGESYLISDQCELALSDLKKGYEIAELCHNENEKTILKLRALFSLAIAYGIIGNIDEINSIGNTMKILLENSQCADCNETIELKENYLSSSQSRFTIDLLSNSQDDDFPILGPENISIDECIERARGTSRLARALILKAKVQVQFALNEIITELESKAIRCCKAGGIWKACLKPILVKWYHWNQKWNIFAMPPDPAWD